MGACAAAGSPIDVAAALSARGYREDGRLVIDVRDEFRPANTGTYELTVEGGKGSCSPTDAEPEIACTVHVVGGTYFGGVSWGTLARPGRLEERVQGAVARTDAMFRSDVAPRPIIHF
jgi:predicted acetyltransferase